MAAFSKKKIFFELPPNPVVHGGLRSLLNFTTLGTILQYQNFKQLATKTKMEMKMKIH